MGKTGSSFITLQRPQERTWRLDTVIGPKIGNEANSDIRHPSLDFKLTAYHAKKTSLN
jgi:hypothetical protein